MTAVDQAAALAAPVPGNAISNRGQVTAVREDGNVNVRIGAAFYPGIPCFENYTNRQVGDWVQVLQAGGVAVVLGVLGPDPEMEIPLVKPSTVYLYQLLTSIIFNTNPTTLWVGQDPNNLVSPPTELVLGYHSGSTNLLTTSTTGHSSSPIYLTVARTADSIGQDGPIAVRVYPHNSDVLSTTTVTPLTSFSSLIVNLEVGERKDIQLPADWVAGITASTPTIRGFVLVPGQFEEPNRPVDTTFAVLSRTTGGISFGQWQAWQPIWSAASGTNPAIGNGTITGRYVQVGKTVTFTAQITAGSTTTFGTTSGGYQLTYPVPPRVGSPDMVCFLRLGGIGSWLGQGVVADSVHMNLQAATSTTDGRLNAITSTSPVAMTSAVTIRVNGTYEAA